jgi:aspartyl protease family protein
LTLSRNDAQKLGLNPQALTYSEQFQTANGVAYGAPVRLREFRLGSFSLHDVQATVMQQSMPISLLGVSVLSRFAGHDVEGDKMTLRW